MVKIAGGGVSTPLPNPQAPAPGRAPAANSVKAVDSGASLFEGSRRAGPVALQTVAQPVTGAVPTLTPEGVDQIAAMKDPVARNYAITQGYADLSNQTAAILGKENGNWCTFGVWASKQAGVSIRGQDLPSFIGDALKSLPGIASAEAKVNAHLKAMGLPQLPSIPSILLKSSAAEGLEQKLMGEGNQIVFAEVGREFARFDQTFGGATAYDPDKVAQFVSSLRPDQAALKDGFQAYAKAQFEADPQKKSQLMLYANSRIVAYEQTRLQSYVEGALHAPDGVFHDAIQGVVDGLTSHLPLPLRWLAKAELKHFGGVDALTQMTGDVFRQAAAKMMMSLSTPHETLHLGSDLPNPPGQSTPYPQDLTTITDPKLKALYEQFRTSQSMKGTAVSDWSNYSDRMNYIFNLFRSRQQDPSLFDPPFASRPQSPSAPARVA